MLVHKNLIPLYTKNQKQLYFKCNLCHFVLKANNVKNCMPATKNVKH